jgi:hypothetical protein
MNCDEALDLLLEVDLEELSRNPQSSLGMHLAECARCRTTAATMIDAQSVLRGALTLQPRRSADQLVDDVLTSGGNRTAPQRRLPDEVRWAIAVPVALAAGIAFLILRGIEPPPSDVVPSVVAREETVSAVEVPEGHSAAIFRTSDPKITVVWIYQENGL